MECEELNDLSNSTTYFLAKVELARHQLPPLPSWRSLYFPINSVVFTHRDLPALSGFASSKNNSVFVILKIPF